MGLFTLTFAPDRTPGVDEHVEPLNYGDAHLLSAGLLVFAFLVLLPVYTMRRGASTHA